ncbi:TolB family protein [Paraflavitalea pollutisoli]|uniref:TolB family protein n=1 Tax=Paraflavitalea pollutisoli TaxID=3034143 RepID=UPI0023EC037E|nr:hypothetical protein [Paraflavitalea sp. H1-2-19X]
MKKLVYWLSLVVLLAACSKDKPEDDNNGTTPGGGFKALGAGFIYYDWATEGIQKVNLQTGVKGQAMVSDTRRNGWDISRDHTLLLEAKDHPDDYDNELYTITNIKDGTLVSQFKKLSGYANHTFPSLSYDNKLIVVPPTDDDGIMLLDLQGKVLMNLVTFQGKKLEGSVEWMPDNTLLFRQGNSLYRTNAAFTQGTLVKTLNFAEWGDMAVSPDGSKIALAGGNHIWLMNSDGTNLTQVTESNKKEVMPVFSPDSKYLLLGYNYTITGTFGRYWYLAIIAADFGKYNVDEGADSRVIPFIPKGETRAEPSDGTMLWR